MDVLSRVLDSLEFEGSIFLRAELSAPWAVAAPHASEIPIHVIPRSPNCRVALFHIPVTGGFWVSTPRGEELRVDTGDVVVLRGDPHTVSDAPDRPAVSIAEVLPRENTMMPPTVVFGGNGDTTHIVCGYFKFRDAPFNPIWSALPEVFSVKALDGPPVGWLAQSIRYFMDEVQSGRPGAHSLLHRLTELMFIEIVRHRMRTLAEGEQNWLRAVQDPVVGPALHHLHEAPEQSWTVESLAIAVNASRSSLARHFTALVNEPPMLYLSRWRIHLAAQMLEQAGGGVAEIAMRVGYESEAAFTRAFKRIMGSAPVTWLRAVRPGSY